MTQINLLCKFVGTTEDNEQFTSWQILKYITLYFKENRNKKDSGRDS